MSENEQKPVEEEREKPVEQDEPDDAVDPGSGGGNGD